MPIYLKVVLSLLLSFGLSACASHFEGRKLNVGQMYTGRDFLIGNQVENNKYGLYSYLIFVTPPKPGTQERYAAAIRTYLSYPTVAASDVYAPKEQLNIFYLMLAEQPPDKILDCLYSQCVHPKEEDIHWMIENYNYARARIILRNTLGARHYGPYIVTVRRPVSTSTTESEGQALIQDMTQVPYNLVEKWIYYFLDKATGQGSSYNMSLEKLRLILLTEIEQFADGLPEVVSSLIYVKEILY